MAFPKWNPTSSLPLDFNQEDEANSGKRWSWCIVLPSSVVLHVTWLTPTGILAQLCPMESPKGKDTVWRHRSLQMPPCLCFPSCHFPFLLFFPQWLNKNGTCKHRNCYPQCCTLQHSFRTCHRTLCFQIPFWAGLHCVWKYSTLSLVWS